MISKGRSSPVTKSWSASPPCRTRTGLGRPVRQRANARASALLTLLSDLPLHGGERGARAPRRRRSAAARSLSARAGAGGCGPPGPGGTDRHRSGSGPSARAPSDESARGTSEVKDTAMPRNGPRSVYDGPGVINVMTVDLERAKGGDELAFASLVEPLRRELQLPCYRLLGSVQDAEDLVQETQLAAWRGLDGLEERASLRSWLYRIATNRSLNAIRERGRRPATEHTMKLSKIRSAAEPSWLEPYADSALPDPAPGPEA